MEEKELFNIQCGEIFISSNSNFRIMCTVCEAYFEDYLIFKEHSLRFNCSVNVSEDIIISHEEYNEILIKTEDYSENIITIENIKHGSDPVQEEFSPENDFKESSDIEWTPEENQPISIFINENEKSLQNVEPNQKQILNKMNVNFKCNFCPKTYASSSTLNLHIRVQHTKENLFECDICDKKFGNSSSLKEHKLTHLNERPYPCRYCNKNFLTKRATKRHELATHEKIRPYKCNLCEKAFTAKPLLKKHEVVHTGERPYKCHLCLSAYATRYSLFCHTRNKHPEEIPLQCTKCLTRFNSDSFLKKHECHPISTHILTTEKTSREIVKCAIHIVNSKEVPVYKSGPRATTSLAPKPYICERCGKSYKTLFQYEIHERSHTGERPFKCNECNKAFSSNQQLKNHVTLHTGEKPYKCTECGKCFRTSMRVRVHIRSHTGERPYKCEVQPCEKAFHSLHNLNEHKIRDFITLGDINVCEFIPPQSYNKFQQIGRTNICIWPLPGCGELFSKI